MPYGELITQLTADISQLEAKLKQAERLLRDFNKSAQALGHIQLGAAVGVAGRSATGKASSSPQDDIRALQDRSRARIADASKIGNAQRQLDREELQRELARERVQNRRKQGELDHTEKLRQARQRLYAEERKAVTDRSRTMDALRNDILRRNREEAAEDRRQEREREAHRKNVTRDANETIRTGQRVLREDARDFRQRQAAGRRAVGDVRFGQESARRSDRISARGQTAADAAQAAADSMKERVAFFAGGGGPQFGEDILTKRFREREKAIHRLGDVVERAGTSKWIQYRDAIGQTLDKLKMFGGMLLVGGLTAWIKKGIELNAEFQRFQMTLKTVLDLSSQVTDRRTGRVLNPTERRAAINQKAISLFQTIGEVAAPTNLTRRELFQVVSENLGFAMQGGAKLGTKQQDTKVISLFAQIAQLAKNLGLPGGERQLSQEIRALFEGDRLQGASVAKLLGITNASELKAQKRKGTLVDFLSERIAPALEQTTSNKDKFNQVLSTMKTGFEDFTRIAFSKAFDNITAALVRMRDAMSNPQFQANAQKLGDVINVIAKAIIDFMQSPWPGRFLSFFKVLAEHWKITLGTLAALKGGSVGLDVLLMGFSGARKVSSLGNLIATAGGAPASVGMAQKLAGAGMTGAAQSVGGAAATTGAAAVLQKIGLSGLKNLKNLLPAAGKIFLIVAIINDIWMAIQLLATFWDKLQADRMAGNTLKQVAQMRARNPVQSKIDRVKADLRAAGQQAMKTREEMAGMSAGDQAAALAPIHARMRVLIAEEARLNKKMGKGPAPESQFGGKQREDAELAKQIIALKAFLAQQKALITGNTRDQLRAEEMAQEIKIRKQFKNEQVFQIALKALRARFRHEETTRDQQDQAEAFGFRRQMFDKLNRKSDSIIAGAKGEIFENAVKVNRGDISRAQGRAMERAIIFEANKRLVDDRRQVVIQSRNLLDDYTDAVEQQTKRQREFHNQLFSFERDTILKRRQLLKDQEAAQRQLNDSIRDEKRATEDVQTGQARRALRNDVNALFGEKDFFGRSLGSRVAETERKRLGGQGLNGAQTRGLGELKAKQVQREVADKIAAGDIEGAVSLLKQNGVAVGSKTRQRLTGLGIGGQTVNEAVAGETQGREGEDEQTRLRDVGLARGEAGERLGDANRALQDLPMEIAKTITELKENFNDSVRQAAKQFRALGETARETVESIASLGGGKSPLAAQMKGIQTAAAAKGGQRPEFFDAKAVAGQVTGDIRASQATGGIVMNVNFQMSPDTRRLMEEVGKMLERDLRRHAPKR